MTMDERAGRDRLDDAVDDALTHLTAVDGFESASRLRTLARLRESGEVDGSSARASFLTARWTWMAASAAMAMLLVFGLTWRALFPASSGIERPTGSTQAERAARPTPPHAAVERPGERMTARAHAAPETSATERPRLTTSRRQTPGGPRTAAGLKPRPPSTEMRAATAARASRATSGDPERLAAFLRAVQQLPPDVWERVDKAGPPVVPLLSVDEAAPIAPITITELPGADAPVAPSRDTP
jgi:hypothetical protein